MWNNSLWNEIAVVESFQLCDESASGQKRGFYLAVGRDEVKSPENSENIPAWTQGLGTTGIKVVGMARKLTWVKISVLLRSCFRAVAWFLSSR